MRKVTVGESIGFYIISFSLMFLIFDFTSKKIGLLSTVKTSSLVFDFILLAIGILFVSFFRKENHEKNN